MNIEYYYNVMRQEAHQALLESNIDIESRQCITDHKDLIIPVLQIRGFKIKTRLGNIELGKKAIEWLKELQDFTKLQLEKE